MSALAIGLLAMWATVALGALLGGVLGYVTSDDASPRRLSARLAILAPVWPVVLLALVWHCLPNVAAAIVGFVSDFGGTIARFFRTADLPALFRKDPA
ncbi:hypothetical protein PBI_FLOOF_68 [Microbacterium phage Floof]|uniref:Uncharacterized protein n=1 Tax=Microbacterium phage Floof TaxID=2201433 RepID=A0A2Z4Q611_9CAUD|nr:hypothetical protein PBI_FLOOF_68 [Microbacterium phage Floof]